MTGHHVISRYIARSAEVVISQYLIHLDFNSYLNLNLTSGSEKKSKDTSSLVEIVITVEKSTVTNLTNEW